MRRGAAALLLWAAATPVLAVECTLSRATYAEPYAGYVLQFLPPDPEGYAPIGGRFEVSVPGLDHKLKGEVISNNGESRPTGFITHGCEGAVTDGDFEACTYWNGVIYGLEPVQGAILLPAEDAAAPQKLLLPDFGRTIRYGQLSAQITIEDAPWDVFALQGCAE